MAGTKYDNKAGGTYELPRCEFLLHRVKQIEANLIQWFKENKYSQGDDYSCWIDDHGNWVVSYSNDYPMQHGKGSKHTFTDQQFKEAQKLNAKVF